MKKLSILGLTLAVMASPAFSNPLAKGLLACKQQENDLKRLMCYDALTDSLKKNGDISDFTPPASGDEVFGLEAKQRPLNEVDEISSIITTIYKNPYGKYRIVLENGQEWHQTDGTRLSLDKGDRVILSRGALDSFFLGKPELNRRIRVTRVK